MVLCNAKKQVLRCSWASWTFKEFFGRKEEWLNRIGAGAVACVVETCKFMSELINERMNDE